MKLGSTVEQLKEDLKYFKDKGEKLYTTTEHYASVDAASVIDEVFDCIYENGMYEDWNERIKEDVTEEDVKNIAYYQDKVIEIDI